jgi:hypothetical protein
MMLKRRSKLAMLQHAVQAALNELGVPRPDYPAPVSNAVLILMAALEASRR